MSDKITPDPEFEALLQYIQESRRLDFRGYKRASLRRRIALRMEAVGAEDFLAYRATLEAQPSEFAELLNTILINVTSFFRDEDAWAVLKAQIIPELVARARNDRPIRIWSVGCANGKEPYSIAMLLADVLGTEDFCRRVKIYATDLDEEALAAARLAIYSAREVEGVPPDYLDRFFERSGNQYVFERDLRKCVIFGRHNVVNDAPISRIDLLACRNLMIYLETETQAVVLPRLHYALTRDGFLFLGKAETQLGRSALFRTVDMKHRIFAKIGQERRRPPAILPPPAEPDEPDRPAHDPGLLEDVFNEAGTPLLVVGEDGAVALANLSARALLGIGEADVGRPFQDLPISYRPIDLRGPIEEAFREHAVVRIRDQELYLGQQQIMRIAIDVQPLYRADRSVHAVLLAFHDQTQLHGVQRELEVAQESLEHSVEELQSANEELETTNEELQSTNEEMETTNEELQSTNEELETINEESRSTNEEMEAVNEELRIHADQAASYRLYLESVLRAMNGGIVVLDQAHVIQTWNRWSENTWGLRADEVISTPFRTLEIGVPTHQLEDGLAAVRAGREEQVVRDLEGVDRRGRRILCRVRITALLGEGGGDHGLVLLFQNVTEERAREEYARYLGRIMGRALNEIYFLDPYTLRFVLTNEGARKKLGFNAGELGNMALPDIVCDISEEDLRAVLAPLLNGTERELVLQTVIQAADGLRHPAELCLQYLADEAPPILIVTVQERGDRKPPAPAATDPA